MIEHEIAKRCRVLLTAPAVQKTLKQLQAWDENTLQEQIEICEITAAPFHEQQRADFFLGKLQQIGLQEIHKDSAGNVLGSSACGNDGKLLIAAHLDTVFAQGTDTRVKRAEGRLHAPGLVDDSRGLAEVLAVARALQYSGIKTWRKVVFCGDVGEEGTGNLRGVRHIFQHTKGISGFVSLDGFMDPAAITYLGMGSKRYEATYTGPGGHSLYNFGRPSAVHAAGRAIAKIAELPSLPGTTFTVGTVKGGSAVNAIAAKAGMQIHLRGENPQNLSKLEQAVQK
ncbi:MAG: M20/M25/M40 family metallo-hydrolase, partial [Oscillospiraceae bacterium]|nr:M20/M25/M40 family metallo-hydrolase [Oscillospiraceae bacterium]